MVAHAACDAVAQILAHQVQVGFALPVNQVARVQNVIYMVTCPRQRVAHGLLLASAEALRARFAQLLLLLVLVWIGCRKVRVGDVQHAERLLQPDFHGGIGQ